MPPDSLGALYSTKWYRVRPSPRSRYWAEDRSQWHKVMRKSMSSSIATSNNILRQWLTGWRELRVLSICCLFQQACANAHSACIRRSRWIILLLPRRPSQESETRSPVQICVRVWYAWYLFCSAATSNFSAFLVLIPSIFVARRRNSGSYPQIWSCERTCRGRIAFSFQDFAVFIPTTILSSTCRRRCGSTFRDTAFHPGATVYTDECSASLDDAGFQDSINRLA